MITSLSKKEAQDILQILKIANPLGMTNDDMADRAMIEYNQGLQPATAAKPMPTPVKPMPTPVKPQAAMPLGITNDDMADKMMIQDNVLKPKAVNTPVVPVNTKETQILAPKAVNTPVVPSLSNDDMADKMMIEDNVNVPAPLSMKQGNLAPSAPKPAPMPKLETKAPAPLQVGAPGNGITIGNPLAGGVSLAPTPQAPVTLPSPKGNISIGNPTGAPEPVMPTPPTPTPAAAAPSGDATEQEVQLLQKLHKSKFNPASRRDQEMLRHLRTAGSEAGGYGDFKTLRNLAYAQQYGANSDYGRLAQKWRDGAGSGAIPKMAGYTALTRRNSGITTLDGNIWVNPADKEWMQKSAAYADVSWEDYKNLDPAEAPENIQTFFSK